MDKKTYIKILLILNCIMCAASPPTTLGFLQEQSQAAAQWTVSSHDKTEFPLIGRHRTVECRECHLHLVFEGTPRSCEACHWERRQDDRFELRLGSHCEDCHTPVGWKIVAPGKWNHSSQTSFRLEGTHRTLDCSDCHKDLRFSNQMTECFSCHEEDYLNAEEPDHSASGYPFDCQICHLSSSRWDSASFSHDAFLLRGQHGDALCSDCHTNRRYQGISQECASCHLAEYANSIDPDHSRAGFSTDCASCHGTFFLNWEGAVFDHSFFPFFGSHKLARCVDCHAGGIYKGLPSDCASCHISDYNSAADPDHTLLGFPTDCIICHGTTPESWEGGKFDHASFKLLGQHNSALCSECHTSGLYKGLPSECVSCHLSDYNSATDPDHKLLGFPTDCIPCHGTAALSWANADFDHNNIWTIKGAHVTLDCSACHISGTNPPTSCYGCHADDYRAADEPDHEAAVFPTNCLFCHKASSTTWEGAVFDHSFFPLLGQHNSALCSECHTSGIYKGLPSDCVSCHLSDYESTTDPDHNLLGFPTDCIPCHGSSALTWEGAVFDHSKVWPLLGPHPSLDCSACHISGAIPPNNCFGCHADDYQATVDPDHEAAGFPTDCVYCHFPTHLLWTQAVFNHLFPITSGKHSSLDCTECHLTANYKEFSCINCHAHNQTNMNIKHSKVSGYSYDSLACYSCHPQGRE